MTHRQPDAGTLVVDVAIPAWNEEEALPLVLADLERLGAERPRRVVVADNNSTDRTRSVAARAGAVVVSAARQGYGSACLAALAALRADPPDVGVFIDADRSDYASDLPALLAPIRAGAAELVIGSRTRGLAEPGSLLPQARFGNRLACALIRLLYRASFSDLGPFRAVTWRALERLAMRDPNFGWTVEMQVKAARQRLAFAEVPVHYRRRVGRSKITGTVRGTIAAGAKILWTVFRYALVR